MTNEEAIRYFEGLHSAQEQSKMAGDIRDIDIILGQCGFDSNQARIIIDKINQEHPENVLLYNIIFQPQGSGISLSEASPAALTSDLRWKRSFLQAKMVGKAFDELQKEMRQNHWVI